MKPESKKTKSGSFPKFEFHNLLLAKHRKRWQVLCGDKNHWRVGYSSPGVKNSNQVKKLEKHSCPELFLLIQGAITLILDEGKGEFELKLEPMKPVMVKGWHAGYCPNGAHTGIALVVERDHFTTIYKKRDK